MMSGFDPLAPRFLADLNRIQARSERAGRQISSGLRVSTASDDPEQVMEILRIKSRISTNEQLQTNLTRVQAQVNSGETALRQSISILERARVLAAQTATTGAPNRPVLAIEARQLHSRLVALTGTSAEGQSVFSGDGSQAIPYSVDWSQPGGVQFNGSSRTNTSQVDDGNLTKFSVSLTASQLFDKKTGATPDTDNAFQALYDLTVALEHDSEAEVQAALPKIEATLRHLNGQLTFYGSAQNRITDAYNAAKKSAVDLKADLSRLQDADLPAAILELNTAKLNHETALAAHSKAPSSTLFDYLG